MIYAYRIFALFCAQIFFMKTNLPVLLFISMLVSAFTWQSCQSTKTASGSRTLKFGLENGKAYDYETVLNMDQEIMGQKLQADMSTYYSLKVISDSADFRTIEASVDRFAMKTGVGGMNIEIDTDKPIVAAEDGKDSALAIVNKLFAAIKHQKFFMKVNSEGSVMEVTGFDKIRFVIICLTLHKTYNRLINVKTNVFSAKFFALKKRCSASHKRLKNRFIFFRITPD